MKGETYDWRHERPMTRDITFVRCEGSAPTLLGGAPIFGGLGHKKAC
jgi:hypothetical protein